MFGKKKQQNRHNALQFKGQLVPYEIGINDVCFFGVVNLSCYVDLLDTRRSEIIINY